MLNVKYGVRFPMIQNLNYTHTDNIFSEISINNTVNIFLNTCDALENLTELVIQKNQTRQLSKQLNAKQRALEECTDNLIEQEKIKYEEYTKRLQEKLEYKKKKIKLDSKKLFVETKEKADEFSISFEKSMKSSQLLNTMMKSEEEFFLSINDYVEFLSDDYSNRKEYVMYCEMERKSLNLIKQYLEKMI